MSSYIGKFVLYGNEIGGFCWGRISAEVKTNDTSGVVDNFVLKERLSYYHGRFTKINHDTLIKKSTLDLDRDIVSLDYGTGGFNQLSNEDLLLLALGGNVSNINSEDFSLGLVNILKAHAKGLDIDLIDYAADLLKSRMAKEGRVGDE